MAHSPIVALVVVEHPSGTFTVPVISPNSAIRLFPGPPFGPATYAFAYT